MSTILEPTSGRRIGAQEDEVKYALSDFFYRDRSKFQAFITQTDIYIYGYRKELDNTNYKIMFIGIYLKEGAII